MSEQIEWMNAYLQRIYGPRGGNVPGVSSASGSDAVRVHLDTGALPPRLAADLLTPEPDENDEDPAYICTSCRKGRHACRDIRCECCAGDSY